MAGTPGARRFTESDKARVMAVLAANDGNVKRTARECDVPPASIRRWRGQTARGQGPSTELVASATEDFIEEAQHVRNLALTQLRAAIEAGDVKPQQLIVTIGVLTEKIALARGLPTSKVEHTSALPKPDELKELMSGFVAGAIEAAERRHMEIVDAEVIEVPALEVST